MGRQKKKKSSKTKLESYKETQTFAQKKLKDIRNVYGTKGEIF